MCVARSCCTINVNDSINNSSPQALLPAVQNLSTYHDCSTLGKLWILSRSYGLERLRCVAEQSYWRRRGHEAGGFVLVTMSNLEGYSVQRFKEAPGDLDTGYPWNRKM